MQTAWKLVHSWIDDLQYYRHREMSLLMSLLIKPTHEPTHKAYS